MPGNITVPAITSSYRLGGAISPRQVLIRQDTLFLAPSGRLHAYTTDGSHLWSRKYGLNSQLIGCWELDGDGRDELVAAHGSSGSRIDIIDAANGNTLWSTPPQEGGVGDIKIHSIDGDQFPEIIWHPAASSEIMVYSFRNGAASPLLMWRTTLPDYVSDPYSFSPIVIGDFLKNGRTQIVIGGGRAQIPVIVLDALTGKELARKRITEGGDESGGNRHMVMLSDLDNDGRQELLQIGDYVSSESYMFQGAAIVESKDSLALKAIKATHGRRMRYVHGSVGDFDGDQVNEILVSRYDPPAQKHVTELLSGKDLSEKAELRLDDFFPLAVLASGGRPLVIGMRHSKEEIPRPLGHLEAFWCRGDRGFQPANWSMDKSALVTVAPRVHSIPDVGNPGGAPVTSVHGGLLLYRDEDQDDRFDKLLIVKIPGGEIVRHYEADRGESLEVLASSEDWIIAGLDSGEVVVLDRGLQSRTKIRIGGFYRNDNGNGHSTDVAIISDIDNDGRNEIVAVNSGSEIFRTDTGEVLRRKGPFHELFVVSGGKGQKYLVLCELQDRHPSISLFSCLEKKRRWTHVFDAFEQNFLNKTFIRGFTAGHFNRDEVADLAVAIGGDDMHQKHLYALNGVTGKELWRSSEGTYWNATMAVWDFDGDGFQDIAYNYDQTKGIIASGRNGRLLSCGISIGNYKNMGRVDYNGALSAVPVNGRVSLLNAEDDAHMAKMHFHGESSATVMEWKAPQHSIDDERSSMGAVAPINDGRLVVCVGSHRGYLEARLIGDGGVLWSIFLENGNASSSSGNRNSLSDVIALDVNNDGRIEFMVGDDSGWLYALDGETGKIVWSLDLGANVGDPIAGDVDHDGFSEIVVPTADGCLYVVDRG